MKKGSNRYLGCESCKKCAYFQKLPIIYSFDPHLCEPRLQLSKKLAKFGNFLRFYMLKFCCFQIAPLQRFELDCTFLTFVFSSLIVSEKRAQMMEEGRRGSRWWTRQGSVFTDPSVDFQQAHCDSFRTQPVLESSMIVQKIESSRHS